MNPRQNSTYFTYLKGKNIFDRMRAYVLLLSQGAIDIPYTLFRDDLVREFGEQKVHSTEEQILGSDEDIIFGNYSLKAIIADFYANPQDLVQAYKQYAAQVKQKERLQREAAERHILQTGNHRRPIYDSEEDFKKRKFSKWYVDKLMEGGPIVSMIEEDEISSIENLSSDNLSQATTLVSDQSNEHTSDYASEESSQYSQYMPGFKFTTNSFSVPNRQKPQNTPVFTSTFGKGGEYGDMSMDGDFDTQIPMSETSVDGDMSGKKYSGRKGNKKSTEGEVSTEETLKPSRSIPTTIMSTGNTDTQNVLDMMAANLQQQQAALNSAKKPAATVTSKNSKLKSSKTVNPVDEKKPHKVTKGTKITKENKSDKVNPPTVISTQPGTQSVYDDDNLETGSSGYVSYDISEISEDGLSFTGFTKKDRSKSRTSTSPNPKLMNIKEKKDMVYWSLASIPLKIKNLKEGEVDFINVDGLRIKGTDMTAIKLVLARINKLANGRVEKDEIDKELSLLGIVGRNILNLATKNESFRQYLLEFKFREIQPGQAYGLGRLELKELSEMYNQIFSSVDNPTLFLLLSNEDYCPAKDIFGWALFCLLFNGKDLKFN